MKTIAIIGTSNSIIGEKGYVKALRNSFVVDNLSIGRTPIHRHIALLSAQHARLAKADLIVLEHYVNDLAFYADAFADVGRLDDYIAHIENFYGLLAAMDVRVVNLLFPIAPSHFKSGPARRCYERILALCTQYGFGLVNLNTLPLAAQQFSDAVHVTPAVSYLIGLGMVPGLHGALATPAPQGGQVSSTPYRVIAARDMVAQSACMTFSNTLVTLEYAPLQGRVRLDLDMHEEVVALGYFNPPKAPQSSGIRLGADTYMLDGKGYFVESLPRRATGPLDIGPATGAHKNLPSLMAREHSGQKSVFAPPNVVEVLIYDPSRPLDCTAATRHSPAFDSAPIQQAIETIALPDIGPKAVDALRDLALRSEGRSIELAYQLMKLAQYGRPHGPLIREKIADYAARLKADAP